MRWSPGFGARRRAAEPGGWRSSSRAAASRSSASTSTPRCSAPPARTDPTSNGTSTTSPRSTSAAPSTSSLLAGNVPLFTPPGTHRALVAGCTRHVAADGVLIAGFQLDRGYGIEAYDADCAAAGLALSERFSTWAGDPFTPAGDVRGLGSSLRRSLTPEYRAATENVGPCSGGRHGRRAIHRSVALGGLCRHRPRPGRSALGRRRRTGHRRSRCSSRAPAEPGDATS